MYVCAVGVGGTLRKEKESQMFVLHTGWMTLETVISWTKMGSFEAETIWKTESRMYSFLYLASLVAEEHLCIDGKEDSWDFSYRIYDLRIVST